MTKQDNILRAEIEAAWAILPTSQPNLSLAGAIQQALDNCPTCRKRRAAKARWMKAYRDKKSKKVRKKK